MSVTYQDVNNISFCCWRLLFRMAENTFFMLCLNIARSLWIKVSLLFVFQAANIWESRDQSVNLMRVALSSFAHTISWSDRNANCEPAWMDSGMSCSSIHGRLTLSFCGKYLTICCREWFQTGFDQCNCGQEAHNNECWSKIDLDSYYGWIFSSL